MIVPRFRLVPDPAAEAALVAAYRSNALVNGPQVEAFEMRLATLAGVAHCVCTANGFGALVLALESLAAGRGAVVLPAVSTCFAPLNAVIAAGAEPKFADVDADGRLCPRATAALIASTAAPCLVLAPAHFGVAVDVDALRSSGCPVLEDDAQAGHLTLSSASSADIRVLSFYPSKHLSAIDGGAVLTNDAALAQRVRDRRYYAEQSRADGVRRYNLRLPALHAAVGLATLEGFASIRERLIVLGAAYRNALTPVPGIRMLGAGGPGIPTRCVIELPAGRAADVLAQLQARGIGASRELVALAPSDGLVQAWPHAAALLENTVSLPFFPDLTRAELTETVAAVTAVMRETNR